MRTIAQKVTSVAIVAPLLIVAFAAVLSSPSLDASFNDYRQVETAAANAQPAAAQGSEVIADGTVVPLASASLAFQMGGRIASVFVEEGQDVEAGEVLIQLDDKDLRRALQMAEIAYSEAQVDVAAAEADLAAAQVELEAATVAIAAAEANLALIAAGPSEEQIALHNAMVAAARAGVQEAVGYEALTLNAVTPGEIRAVEAQLAAAQAEFIAVRAVRDGVMRDENASEEVRAQAQLQLDAAIARVESTQASLDELLAGATDAQRRAASAAVSGASLEASAAEAELALLMAGARPEAVAIIHAQIGQAERAREEAELGVEQAEMIVERAQMAVEEAETVVMRAQAELEKTRLVAPFAGTVALISVKEGEGVKAQTPILTLADYSAWRIMTLDLSEIDVVDVASGDEVEVTIDAFADAALRGWVVDVAATIDANASNDVVYVVSIALEEVDLPLRWGMTALISQSDRS